MYNNQSTLVGLFKEVYGDNVVDAWGYMARIAKRIAFRSDFPQNGNYFHVPIDMQLEHGVSYAAAGVTNSGTTTGSTAATTTQFLNPSPGQMQDAQVAPAQLIGRSQVTYEAIARSANDRNSFERATKRIVKRLSQAVMKRLEIQLLHGQQGIGIIDTASAVSTQLTITITPATWSAAIFAGEKGATVDIYASNLTTKRNATTLTAGNCTITAIDPATRTITITAAANGDISGVIPGDYLFFETSSSVSDLAGLGVIASNTGNLFNINAATYELWAGNNYSTSTGVLSMGKLLEMSSMTATYGNQTGLTCVIPVRAYEVINTDQAALRVYAAEAKKGKNGFETLSFGAQCGVLEVLPHPFQKDGSVFCFNEEEAYRVGSQDVSFITRGEGGEKLILESSSSPASEMRCYSGQALFVELPKHTVIATGVTYS